MEQSSAGIDIVNLTRRHTPTGVPFVRIAKAVLGVKYDLAIVFIGARRSRNLNNKYRNKDKETNVLSFPLDKNSGEIYLNLNLIEKQVKNFDRKYTNLVAYLFIHGLLHLKGMDHGSTMEKKEEEFLSRFGF